MLQHGLEHLAGIADGHVDLAADRVGLDTFVHQLGQALVLLAHHLGHQQPGDHAAVAVAEVAEEMMRAHLAAIDGVGLAQGFLHEGVARFALDGLAAMLSRHVLGVPDQTRIVHHAFAGVLLEHLRGEQADDVVTLDETTVLVEQETAVEVAVPGDAEVGSVFADGFDGGAASLGQQRIGHAVGEATVRLVEQLDELEGQHLLEHVENRSGDAVTGIDHDLEGLEFAGIADVAHQVIDIGLGEIGQGHLAFLVRVGEVVLLGQFANLLQAAVAADRAGAFANELEAVVIYGVVAGGDHDAAIETKVEGGEIDLLGAADAEVEHIDAAVHQAAG